MLRRIRGVVFSNLLRSWILWIPGLVGLDFPSVLGFRVSGLWVYVLCLWVFGFSVCGLCTVGFRVYCDS